MAFRGKRRLEELDEEDLEEVALYLKDIYSHLKPVQNFISVIFTNSHFVQSAKPVEEKEAYADQILFAFRNDRFASEGDVRCTFFPELAAIMKAHRQHIPLLNGESVSNFSPMGTQGIPVSGLALLAIHAMPLGCYKCGNLLAFHQLSDMTQSDAGKMNLVLARRALEANLKAISMMSPDRAEGNMPSFGSYAKTRYVDMILRAKQEAQGRSINIDNITGYYFTNYGPKPNLEIIRLDNAVLGFVDAAQQDLSNAWRRVVYSGWKRPKGEEEAQPDEQNTETWRNDVYERLFDLPNKVQQFIHFLAVGNDWRLIALFLERVLNMQQSQIDNYRRIGIDLAEYVAKYDVRRDGGVSWGLYHKLKDAKYSEFRKYIRAAREKASTAGAERPLITVGQFIDAFERSNELYNTYYLARDLIVMCMFDHLHELGFTMKGVSEQVDDNEQDGYKISANDEDEE